MFSKIKNRIFISIAIAAIMYLAFLIYADYEKVITSFRNFNWLLLPLLLLLSFGNYLSRFFKWGYYLKIIQVKLHFIDSLSIFMSGLIMSVTPGKMGELLKSYLVKQVNGTSISKTAPIVFAERATDFLSLTILALAGAYYYDYGKGIIVIIGIVMILGLVIITNKRLFEKIISLLSKNRFLSKYIQKISTAYESSSKLLSVGPLLLMTLLSVISWGFECFGYYLILTNFEIKIDIFWSFFSYSFATIVGALSMLPGGLGVTEGSLTLMLVQKGLSEHSAFAATFIVRAVTLWFAVLVGAISLIFYQKRFGRIVMESNTQTVE
ncbi:MAG TPA: lysylphosphatidylglycerol synthase transmembrane domain-containing protein [Ignavibacteriaceae bacterium]